MNKKKIQICLFTFIVMGCLVLSSCSGLWDIQETADISFNVNVQELLSTATTTPATFSMQQSSRADVTYKLVVTVALYNARDDFPVASASQEKNINLSDWKELNFGSDIDFRFAGISVGSSVQARVTIKMHGDNLPEEGENLFYGESEEIVVRGGENTLVCRMERSLLDAVYLDSGTGTEHGTGSKALPVKTIAGAVEILKAGKDSLPKDATIWVMNTITINTSTNWSDYAGLTLVRHDSNKNALIDVTEGTLTLKNITIDGDSDRGTTATSPLITVKGSSAILRLESGTALQNNNNTYNSDSVDGVAGVAGGGVSLDSGSKLTMNGGIITGNTAAYGGGGGVEIVDGILILEGGQTNIRDNKGLVSWTADDTAIWGTNDVFYFILENGDSDIFPVQLTGDLAKGSHIGLNPYPVEEGLTVVKVGSNVTLLTNENVNTFFNAVEIKYGDDGTPVLETLTLERHADGNIFFPGEFVPGPVYPAEVYLHPATGNDDTGTGTNENPVRTMATAIAILKGDENALPKDATIWVMSTITITADTEWDYADLTLKRYAGENNPAKAHKGALIDVTGGTLTLKNITIDGDSGRGTTATSPLITVKGSSAILLLESGTALQNNNSTYSSEDRDGVAGGGVSITNDGTFTMSDGRISGNTVLYGGGGGVYINGGIFNMNGGTITQNTVSRGGGGGVSITNDGTFTMSGGRISNNTAADGGGVFVVSGTFNLGGESSQEITISENTLIGGTTKNNIKYNNTATTSPVKVIGTLATGSSIGLSPTDTTEEAVVVEKGSAYAGDIVASHFGLDAMPGTPLELNSAGDLIVPRTLLEHVYLHPTTGNDDTGTGTQASPVKTMTAAIDLLKNDGTVWVMGTINVTSNEEWPSVGSSKTGITVKRSDGFVANLVEVTAGVMLTLSNITLDGGSTLADKPLIIVNGNNATLTVGNGAKLQNNHSTNSNGGAVLLDNGTFNMSGGSISGNTAATGGGVHINNGTFTMSGGTISGNTATNNGGGGVYNNSARFNMSGGTISDNKATKVGGGVYNNSSNTFNMSGGTISGNTATKNGGGVYNNSNTFNMSGGTISGNTAANGGGVFIASGILNLSNQTSESTSQKITIRENTLGGSISNNIVYTNQSDSSPVKVIGALATGSSIGLSPTDTTKGAVVVEKDSAYTGETVASHFTLDAGGTVKLSGTNGNLVVDTAPTP